MRVLIDLQNLQAANWDTPYHAFAWALSRAVARGLRDRGDTVVLLLDGRFEDAVHKARTAFAGLVSARNFRLWFPPPDECVRSGAGRRAIERLYEAFVARLGPDFVYVASLSSSNAQATFTSVGRFTRQRTAIAVHDLGAAMDAAAIEAISSADLCITTSEWARQSIAASTGLEIGQCLAVSAAVGDEFRNGESSSTPPFDLRTQWGLARPFVVCFLPSGNAQQAKGVIQAFALLPLALRSDLQLVVAHAAPHEIVAPALADLAGDHQLDPEDVVTIDAASPATRAELFRRCELTVALASMDEAFCFVALEAMSCGAPVIAARQSSLPELLGDSVTELGAEAMFDGADPYAIAASMTATLTSATFRNALSTWGRERSKVYSVKTAAESAVAEIERLANERRPRAHSQSPSRRPRLAYVSPLPPERSGIAAYSADLLPHLVKHYDIELISESEHVDETLASLFPVRNGAYFLSHADSYDRVLYHIGNSAFHRHMFELLALVPGTVVLHDFFLGDIHAYREHHQGIPNVLEREIYDSHGYGALAEGLGSEERAKVVARYPCSFGVIRQAQGVIVHSPHSAELAQRWFGDEVAREFAQIPLLRRPRPDSGSLAVRQEARRKLGLTDGDFLVCSFGMLGRTKQNDRLLRAWQASLLASSPNCKLVFVGQNDDGAYAAELQAAIDRLGSGRVTITGWASTSTFDSYLEAADLAVQLRAHSRGETSAAVLDTMNHGIPTIVNSHGAMAYLPSHAVVILNEEFSDAELVDALNQLWQNPARRAILSANAQAFIAARHAPATCSERYVEAIERFSTQNSEGRNALIRSIRQSDPLPSDAQDERAAIARAISETLPATQPAKQIFLDISALVNEDLHTGIQRVMKSLLRVLIDSPPPGFRVEAVYAPWGRLGYRYARQFTLRFLGCPEDLLEDAPISFQDGDQFVGVDLLHQAVPFQAPYFDRMRQAGVGVHFVVYDLLPVLLPHRFPDGSAAAHTRWLHTIRKFDSALCISNAVASELSAWLDQNAPEWKQQGFKIRSFHLGADLSAAGSKGVPAEAAATLDSMAANTSFLMVGTVEPRKGHALALDAFDRLWNAGQVVNLIIVGKQGWMMEEVANRIRNHPEYGKRLFWLEKASDEYLEKVYAISSCLLAPSEGEGFGLPLIEGAQHGLPILARDLPVFREVAGPHAMYFQGSATSLAAMATQWMLLMRQGRHPRSDSLNFLSWQQSAEEFVAALLDTPSARATGVCSSSRQMPAAAASEAASQNLTTTSIKPHHVE